MEKNSNIQAVLFPINWSSKDCRKWLKTHRLEQIKRSHQTDNYRRYRIKDPSDFKKFITKELKDGVKLIIGYV